MAAELRHAVINLVSALRVLHDLVPLNIIDNDPISAILAQVCST